MPKLNKEQVKKVRAVQRAITAEPELYDQRDFVGSYDDPCGTACCLAGWFVWNESHTNFEELAKRDRSISNVDWTKEADRALGYQTPYNLFGSGNCWPEPFRSQFRGARSPKAKAAVACARLDYLIETGL